MKIRRRSDVRNIRRSACGSDVKEKAADEDGMLGMTQIDDRSERPALNEAMSQGTTHQLMTAIDDEEEWPGKPTVAMNKSAITAIGYEALGRSHKLANASTEVRVTSSLMFSMACVSLASFQFGYNNGCVNAPSGFVIEWIIASHKRMFNTELDKATAELIWSMVVSVYGVGAMVGGLSCAALADKVGRRGSLFYTNIIAFLAAALMGLAKMVDVYPMMFFGRFFIGIYVGLTVIVPIYLTEISPKKFRGTFGSIHQLLITISILFSQLLGLPQFFGTPDRWPYIFGFVALPALLQIIVLPMIPEPPRFTLCIRDEVERATQDLELLRGTDNVHAEIEEMLAEALRTKEDVSDIPSMLDMFRRPLLWPSALTILLMMGQQLTGINAAIFYSTMLFKELRLTEKGSVYATFTMGIVNVLMTIVANLLVDKPSVGRRVLMLSGIVGMLITSLLLVASISLSMTGAVWATYASVGFILLFVMSFAAGPGSVPWFFPCEIVFTNARANACALTSLANWTTNAVVSFTFVLINNYIRQFSFLVFFCFLILYFVFVWKYVPETTDKTVEEIVAGFKPEA